MPDFYGLSAVLSRQIRHQGRTVNPQVAGSSPARGAKNSKKPSTRWAFCFLPSFLAASLLHSPPHAAKCHPLSHRSFAIRIPLNRKIGKVSITRRSPGPLEAILRQPGSLDPPALSRGEWRPMSERASPSSGALLFRAAGHGQAIEVSGWGRALAWRLPSSAVGAFWLAACSMIFWITKRAAEDRKWSC